MSTRYGRGIMVALALLAGALGAHAQTTNTWQGGTTAWATPGNWSEGVVPGDTHDVVIDGGMVVRSEGWQRSV